VLGGLSPPKCDSVKNDTEIDISCRSYKKCCIRNFQIFVQLPPPPQIFPQKNATDMACSETIMKLVDYIKKSTITVFEILGLLNIELIK